MLTYPLTPPTAFQMARVTIRQNSIVGESTSPFSAASQTYEHQGRWWEMEVTLPPMQMNDGMDVAGWIFSLMGKKGSFLLGDPINTAPRGVSGGTPLVDGAAQSGLVLNIKGLPLSTMGVYKRGDWMQLGSGADTHLHMFMADVSSDGSGLAAADIWPQLRASPADGAAVVVNNTKGLWMLSGNQQNYDLAPGRIVQGITLAFKEDLRP